MLKENYGVEIESEMVDSIGMRKIFFFTIVSMVLFLSPSLWGQSDQGPSGGAGMRKLYQLPENMPKADESHLLQNILAGTESGLYKIIGNDTPEPLWNESRVTQIVETVVEGRQVWFFVTGHGLLRSTDLETFTVLGAAEGLPMLTLK